jgi:hypothetical protein
VYQEHIQGSSKVYTVTANSRILKDFTFHPQGRCLFCDKIAPLLLGEPIPTDTDDVWAFESLELALHYFLLCLILTIGSSSYYLGLQQRARKAYRRVITNVQEVGTATKATEKLNQGDYFLIAFGTKEVTEMPFFYVIGNNKHKGFSHHLSQTEVVQDFAVAVGDLGYLRRNYENDKRKGGSRVDPGSAAYIHPLRAHIA